MYIIYYCIYIFFSFLELFVYLLEGATLRECLSIQVFLILNALYSCFPLIARASLGLIDDKNQAAI